MAHATTANQGLSTASQHSCHVHDIMPVCAKQERNGPASAHQGPPYSKPRHVVNIPTYLPLSHHLCYYKTYLQNENVAKVA